MTLFNIKLISGSNLVLVESCGYGSEIFQPEIIDGAIHLNNVIQHRRKTSTVLRDSTNKIKILSVEPVKNALELMSDSGTFHSAAKEMSKGTASSAENSLASSGYFSTNSVDTPPTMRACSKPPVKHSTPVLLPDLVSERTFTPPHKNFLTSRGKQQEIPLKSCSSYVTPSPILSYSLNMPKPKIVSLLSLGPNLKIVKLYRKPTESDPPDKAKIVHMSNAVKKNNTFTTPAKSARKLPGPQTPVTVTKWRKCITPAKTYSKRGNIQRKQVIVRSVKKTGMRTYIPNPTIGIEGSAEITVKTIRTTIDQRTTIGPKEFKQQMRSTEDLKNTSSLDVRTKEEFYHARFSAFDLLVNPVRKKSLSEELHRMFRTKCTKKSAPVELKFKPILDDIPSLDYIPPARKRFKF